MVTPPLYVDHTSPLLTLGGLFGGGNNSSLFSTPTNKQQTNNTSFNTPSQGFGATTSTGSGGFGGFGQKPGASIFGTSTPAASTSSGFGSSSMFGASSGQ